MGWLTGWVGWGPQRPLPGDRAAYLYYEMDAQRWCIGDEPGAQVRPDVLCCSSKESDIF